MMDLLFATVVHPSSAFVEGDGILPPPLVPRQQYRCAVLGRRIYRLPVHARATGGGKCFCFGAGPADGIMQIAPLGRSSTCQLPEP